MNQFYGKYSRIFLSKPILVLLVLLHLKMIPICLYQSHETTVLHFSHKQQHSIEVDGKERVWLFIPRYHLNLRNIDE